jgi:hypothetical protein
MEEKKMREVNPKRLPKYVPCKDIRVTIKPAEYRYLPPFSTDAIGEYTLKYSACVHSVKKSKHGYYQIQVGDYKVRIKRGVIAWIPSEGYKHKVSLEW